MEYRELQNRLASVQTLNTPDSESAHAVVLLPSFSVGESLLSHYSDRIPALEHRFLVGLFALRLPATRLVYVCTEEPAPEVIDHYLSLLPSWLEPSPRGRFEIVAVPDPSARAVAAKLLDRPDLVERIRAWIGDTPALMEPWNVTEPERDLALALEIPLSGTDPDLWPLGFKSAGRKLFRQAKVPVPPGSEDLRSVSDVVAAIERLRTEEPDTVAVVIKHDDSGAGDGNAVVRVDDVGPVGSEVARRRVLSRINSLEPWYLADIELGCVVEQRIVGDRFSSPSAQVEIGADGSTRVLSTHEQILGGDDGQIYLGCSFPADPAYAPELGARAAAAAEALAGAGALGRMAVDFVAASKDGGPWSTYAVEVNLRKGGTTHPFAVLRHLAPGYYDPDAGVYTDNSGRAKFYMASDNIVDEAWTGVAERDVIAALDRAGLTWNQETRTGVVPHMLSCLAVDGRFGITAVGDSSEHAEELQAATIAAVNDWCLPA
jgi:hypothetical protein